MKNKDVLTIVTEYFAQKETLAEETAHMEITQRLCMDIAEEIYKNLQNPIFQITKRNPSIFLNNQGEIYRLSINLISDEELTRLRRCEEELFHIKAFGK